MSRKVSDAQKSAVRFCEDILGIRYTHDIEDVSRVSLFLDKYLNKASKKYEKIASSRLDRLKNFYDVYGGVISRKKNRRG